VKPAKNHNISPRLMLVRAPKDVPAYEGTQINALKARGCALIDVSSKGEILVLKMEVRDGRVDVDLLQVGM
jgi:hypothetical protein